MAELVLDAGATLASIMITAFLIYGAYSLVSVVIDVVWDVVAYVARRVRTRARVFRARRAVLR